MSQQSWHPVVDDKLPWTASLNRILASVPPPELGGSAISVFSDISGQHSRATHTVYSLLAVDFSRSDAFLIERAKLRRDLLMDGRRMSYKRLNDQVRARALVPFLSAADKIDGVLLTISVDTAITNLLAGQGFLDTLRATGRLHAAWTLPQFEEMFRVVAFVVFLLATCIKKGQDVYWISDRDPIFDTTERTHDVRLMATVLTKKWTPVGTSGSLNLGTTSIDTGDRLEEDFAAIADLAAGGVAHLSKILGPTIDRDRPDGINLTVAPPEKYKDDVLLSWLFETAVCPLRKVNVLFQRNKGKTGVMKLNLLR